MKLRFICWGLLFLMVTESHAVGSLPNSLIDFSSRPGAVLFQTNVNPHALKLLEHFTTQKTLTYCGIASAVMILNSSGLAAPLDSQHTSYHYFTQEDFFTDKVKQIITPEEVQINGISLYKLNQVLQSFGMESEIFYANDLSLSKFRSLLRKTFLRQQFIIVNFLRTELQEQGGGHHSPLAAYDRKTDRVLLLDVARYKYPAYWVKVEDLWKAINTKDAAGVYRGMLIISPRAKNDLK